MMLLISLIILIALGYINYFITRNLLHPSVVYSVIWAIQLAGLIFFSDIFIELSINALFIVVLGAIMFSAGTHIPTFGVNNRASFIHPRRIRCDFVLFWLSAVVVAICIYGQYRKFIDLTEGQDFATSLVYSRTLISVENEDVFGLYKYGSSISMGILMALQILIIKNKAKLLHKVMFFYFMFATLFMAIMSTGRGPIAFLFLLLGLVYIFSSDTKRIGRRLIFVIAGLSILVLVVFWVMGSAMGKVEDDALGAIYNLVGYLFSSIPALSVYLNQHQIDIIGGDWGSNTLRFIYALLAAVGLADNPLSLVQEDIPVPHLTNLYTTYLHYVKDFGWAGVVALPFCLGFIYGHLFRRSMQNNTDDFILLMLSISYLPLLQTVFQETHFSLMSSWIQFVLIGLVITKAYKNNHGEPLYG